MSLLNLFKKKVIVYKSQQKYTHIEIFLFHEINNKQRDKEYFGFLRTPYYNTFGKISQKQVESIASDFAMNKYTLAEEFSFKKNNQTHFDKEDSLKAGNRINLAIPYMYYTSEKVVYFDGSEKFYLNEVLRERSEYFDEKIGKLTKEEKEKFQTKTEFLTDVIIDTYERYDSLSIQQIICALKDNPVLQLAYNDFGEVVFGHKNKFSYRSPHKFVFIKENFNNEIKDARSVKEIVEIIISKSRNGASDSFKKQLTKYIVNNLINSSASKGQNFYTLNQDLINICFFLAKYIDFRVFSYEKVEKLIKRLESESYYFCDSMFYPVVSDKKEEGENYHSFVKILDRLEKDGFDMYKVLSKWDIYPNTAVNIAKMIDSIEFVLPRGSVNNLQRMFNFIGRKILEKSENFKLDNFIQDKDVNDLEKIMISGYQVKLVRNLNDLIQYGTALDNCAGSQTTIDYYKERITFVLENNEKIEFMGCINKGRLDQFKGYKNASPSLELFLSMYEKLRSEGFLLDMDKQIIHKRYLKQFPMNKERAFFETHCVQH